MAFQETTIQSEFYSPWPKLGKMFSHQLNEIRSNMESLHPVVRAVGLDSSYTAVKNAAVASFEIGETDFHNKYRIFWDKTRNTFRLQQNTGTLDIPSWTDRITIGSSGEVVGSFYVNALSSLTVKDGSLPDFHTDTLTFNKAEFYLTKDSVGKPMVNLGTVTATGGGGVTAHSALTGLTAPADDHTQYLLASQATDRSTFTTNWADLTDTGATTLHKHSHSSLDNLSADDHTQYLLVSGSRAMTGDLDMGDKDLLNAHSAVFNDKVSAEAFYLRRGGEVKAYEFNNTEFYVTRGSIGQYVVNLITDPSTIQLTTTKSTAISNPAVFTPSKITLNRDDFYITKTKTTNEVLVNIARGVGSILGGGNIVVKDGTPPIFNTDTLTFNNDQFYLTKDSVGKPMVNITTVSAGGGGLSSITVKEATSPNYSTDTLTFNSADFYLTHDTANKPIVNLVDPSGIIITDGDRKFDGITTLGISKERFYISRGSVANSAVVNYKFRGVMVSKNANQSIASNASGTDVLTWETLRYDTDGTMWNSGANTLLTVPAGAAWVRLTIGLNWLDNGTDPTSSSGNFRRAILLKNGAATIVGSPTCQVHPVRGENTVMNVISPPLSVIGGDTFSVRVNQVSPAATAASVQQAIATWFAMEILA